LTSRPTPGGDVRRRRLCDGCGGRFTTYERVHADAPVDPVELVVVNYIRNLDTNPEEMIARG
jgi:transcriptional regulator NrdR family protein